MDERLKEILKFIYREQASDLHLIPGNFPIMRKDGDLFPLSQFPKIFPSLIIEGMKTAERTGQLAEITLTIFNFYNETVENQTATLGEALQPFLIVILGIALGLLEASLLIPLLTLTKYVQTF
jgi:hypothetical protein